MRGLDLFFTIGSDSIGAEFAAENKENVGRFPIASLLAPGYFEGRMRLGREKEKGDQ